MMMSLAGAWTTARSAERGDRAVDETGLTLRRSSKPKPQLRHHLRPEILDHDVALRGEPARERGPSGSERSMTMPFLLRLRLMK
jgi:hypothetical protein